MPAWTRLLINCFPAGLVMLESVQPISTTLNPPPQPCARNCVESTVEICAQPGQPCRSASLQLGLTTSSFCACARGATSKATTPKTIPIDLDLMVIPPNRVIGSTPAPSR